MNEEFFHPQYADPDREPPLDMAAFERFLDNISDFLEENKQKKLADELAAQKAKGGK